MRTCTKRVAARMEKGLINRDVKAVEKTGDGLELNPKEVQARHRRWHQSSCFRNQSQWQCLSPQ